jgi:branched-chain amino acid aminotransferase
MFGDGVYEVLRTYGRRPFLVEAHQRRLRESAARIALPVPDSDERLLELIQSTIDAVPGNGEVYVRVLLTRGMGELSYDPAECPRQTLVVIARPHAAPPETLYTQGIRLAVVDVVRNHPQSVDPRIKSNNLLNNALAMRQALKAGGVEALMRNYRGEIVECSQSNFFLVRDGEVMTPPLESGLLAGVTRGFVFELGKECGIAVHEAHIHAPDVATADEAFITSTIKEIAPVVRIDDQVIANGEPGPVTRRLHEAFRRHAAELVASPLSTS